MATENYQPQVVRSLARGWAQCYLLFKEGRVYVHAITLESQVRTVELPKEERRHFQPLLRRGKPYDVDRACRRFLAAGRTLGITDGARAVLKALRESAKAAS